MRTRSAACAGTGSVMESSRTWAATAGSIAAPWVAAKPPGRDGASAVALRVHAQTVVLNHAVAGRHEPGRGGVVADPGLQPDHGRAPLRRDRKSGVEGRGG